MEVRALSFLVKLERELPFIAVRMYTETGDTLLLNVAKNGQKVQCSIQYGN